MEIKFEPQALKKATEEGVSEEEIDVTIRTGKDLNSASEWLGKTKIFPFKAERNNTFYDQKKLDVYFSVENKIITALAIDVFYGTFS
jgi:hypothetical protein